MEEMGLNTMGNALCLKWLVPLQIHTVEVRGMVENVGNTILVQVEMDVIETTSITRSPQKDN